MKALMRRAAPLHNCSEAKRLAEFGPYRARIEPRWWQLWVLHVDVNAYTLLFSTIVDPAKL